MERDDDHTVFSVLFDEWSNPIFSTTTPGVRLLSLDFGDGTKIASVDPVETIVAPCDRVWIYEGGW